MSKPLKRSDGRNRRALNGSTSTHSGESFESAQRRVAQRTGRSGLDLPGLLRSLAHQDENPVNAATNRRMTFRAVDEAGGDYSLKAFAKLSVIFFPVCAILVCAPRMTAVLPLSRM